MLWYSAAWIKFLGFVTGIGLTITPWLNPYFYHRNPQTNPSEVSGNRLSDRRIWPTMWWKYGPNETPPPWTPYGIPADSRRFDSLQTVPMIPLSGDCPQNGRQITESKLNEAFVVTNPLDIQYLIGNQNLTTNAEEKLRQTNRELFGDIPYGRFLIIQEFARNTGSPDQGTSGYAYTALANTQGGAVRLPLHFDGGYPLFGWESKPYWYAFPVRSDEQVFTLYFCDSENPMIQTLRFNEPNVSTVRGAYSFTYGLYIP